MNPTPEEFERISEGKRASFLLGELRPALEEIRQNILMEMKSLHRSGTATEAKLLAVSAKLCTLDDIEEHFSGKVADAQSIVKGLEERKDDE